MSYATRYQAVKRQQADARDSTPEAEQERIALQGIADQVSREIDERWPELNVSQAAEILRFQRERNEELRKEAGLW